MNFEKFTNKVKKFSEDLYKHRKCITQLKDVKDNPPSFWSKEDLESLSQLLDKVSSIDINLHEPQLQTLEGAVLDADDLRKVLVSLSKDKEWSVRSGFSAQETFSIRKNLEDHSYKVKESELNIHLFKSKEYDLRLVALPGHVLIKIYGTGQVIDDFLTKNKHLKETLKESLFK